LKEQLKLSKLVTSLSILAFFVCQSCFAHGQTGSQVLSLMQENHWRSQNSWFGDSVVTLIPYDKCPMEDTTGYTKTIGDSTYELYDKLSIPNFRDDLHFDASGKFCYDFFIPCLVGEVIYDVASFEIVDNQVLVSSTKYNSDQLDRPFTAYVYDVILVNKNKIVLHLK